MQTFLNYPNPKSTNLNLKSTGINPKSIDPNRKY